jgi:hypothetical protein
MAAAAPSAMTIIKMNEGGKAMKRRKGMVKLAVFMVLLFIALALGACGSSNKEASSSATATGAAQVGTEVCRTCHTVLATQDITMANDPSDSRTIFGAWADSLHTTNPFETVQCENCHGGGGNHYGMGPLPYPVPGAPSCAPSGASGCHETFGGLGTSWAQTTHANSDNSPDQFFFQGGTGLSQAEIRGVPEFVSGSSPSTPVTINQHIEECSVCHDSNQKFYYDSVGNLTKPDPNNMPHPEIACGNCHDAHQVAKTVTIPQRGTNTVPYVLPRKVQVDVNGANDAVAGTWKRAALFQTNGAVDLSTGIASTAGVIGTNNELNIETLCASCHTVGKYKYGRSATHQSNIYAEWKDSGHGSRNDPGFAEFSANPTAYVNPNTGLNYTPADATHQSLYPYDMALGSTIGGSGSTLNMRATTTANAGVPGSQGPNDNYQCFKCHNGLTSIAYQEDVEGTSNAPVVFGDEPVICITCHDPHSNSATTTKNVRAPQVMSKYFAAKSGATATVQFSGNVFWDNTPLPTIAPTPGNGVICIFCHQGRESGYTLFKRKLWSDATTTNQNFFNPHYLGTAAMLWARNAYEYSQVTGTPGAGTGMMYGAVTQHQQTNCTGCHMATAIDTTDGTIGGHTWKIISETDQFVNNATCNTSACHNGAVPATNASGQLDNYRLASDTHDYDGNGNSTEGIPVEIQNLTNKVIALLQVSGIEYDDTAYPYFFPAGSPHSAANPFKAWNLSTFKAAFNMSFVIKGQPSGSSKINVPNTSAATHNYRYNIQLLIDSYTDLWNNLTLRSVTIPASIAIWGGGAPTVTLNNPNTMFRPTSANDRPATNYDPQGGGAYNTRQ